MGNQNPQRTLSDHEGNLIGKDYGLAVNDPYLALAEQEIESLTGNKVSVFQKKKSLFKFGETLNADSGVKTTVANFQGTVVNETLATGNTVDSIVSDNVNDTGIVTVEGHYFSGDDLIFHIQQVTLNGQTPVSLSQALARSTRAAVTDGTIASPAVDLVGNVYVYDSALATGVTNGVPDVATATKLMITAGNNQSKKCATSLSSTDYWIVTEIFAAMEKGTGGTVVADIEVECKKLGGVWVPMGLQFDLRSSVVPDFEEVLKPYRIIPPNTDVRMVAVSDGANTEVVGHINGQLATIVT